MKKILLAFLLVITIVISTGCIKRDTMEDITIYTTTYPIEYITNYIYGDNSKVKSIYPNGVITSQYELTDIELKEYSKKELFVFNGLSKEKNYINTMISNNKKLKIIDSTKSIDYENDEAELWLNPSNVLMMAKNITTGLNEYISNQYLKNNINKKYEELQLVISKLEAKIYLMAENADEDSIVVGNDALKFLEKYNLNVHSLDNDTTTEKTKETVKSLINKGKINYIFLLNSDEKTEFVSELEKSGKVKIAYIHNLSNLTETERKNNKDYVSITNDNIDALRKELYND